MPRTGANSGAGGGSADAGLAGADVVSAAPPVQKPRKALLEGLQSGAVDQEVAWKQEHEENGI